MSFKKSRKNKNENTKEKKAIATRLIVISLKMDDYIYKNKPISAQDAQMYIEEITNYKEQCINDVRSRQVIEKLTLFLKSIIKQNTLRNVRNENPSIETDIENINKSLTTIPENKITICEASTVNINAVDINQLNTYIDTLNIIDADSFSNLSINPCKENLNKNIFDQTKLSADTDNDQFRENNSIPIINHTEGCNMNLNDLENENTLLNRNVLQNDIIGNNKAVIENISSDKVDNSEGTEVTAPSNICVDSVHEINDTIMLEVNDKRVNIEVTTNKPNRKFKTKLSNKDKKPQRKQTKSKKSEGVSKKNRKNTIEPIKEIQSKCSNIENENLPDKVLDNEIIDVSWIENIEYVRDVCKDENDLTLNNLEETFWNDLTLPVNWNFNDFDYTD